MLYAPVELGISTRVSSATGDEDESVLSIIISNYIKVS